MIGISACTIEYVKQYLVLIIVDVIQYLLKNYMVRSLSNFTWHARLGWRLFMRIQDRRSLRKTRPQVTVGCGQIYTFIASWGSHAQK